MSKSMTTEIEQLDHDNKHVVEHHDDVEADKQAIGYVADTDAANYVDPNLVIDEAEDKRLRRLIHKRYITISGHADSQGAAHHVRSLPYAGTRQRYSGYLVHHGLAE